jgi:hypothetical protein
MNTSQQVEGNVVRIARPQQFTCIDNPLADTYPSIRDMIRRDAAIIRTDLSKGTMRGLYQVSTTTGQKVFIAVILVLFTALLTLCAVLPSLV